MAVRYAKLIELAVKKVYSHSLSLGTVHLERLGIGFRIGPIPPIFLQEGYVDTGAYLSIFPEAQLATVRSPDSLAHHPGGSRLAEMVYGS